MGNAPIALLVTGDTGHIEDQQKESERIELFAAGYRAYMSGDERAEVFADLLHKRRAPLVGSEESRNTRLRKVGAAKQLHIINEVLMNMNIFLDRICCRKEMSWCQSAML